MLVDETSAVAAECDGETVHFCSEGCRDRYFSERPCPVGKSSYELVIVGGGPAGLTAAVYAATTRIDTFMVTKDLGGQAVDGTKIVNYMGFDFITGPELIAKFRDQPLRSHYVAHLIGSAEKIERAPEGLVVTDSDLRVYTCRALILATGMTRKTLGVPGEERLQRRGIFYGHIQDYSFVMGEDVAVVGGGNSAMQMVEALSTVAAHIHILSDVGITADPAIAEKATGRDNVFRHENVNVLSFEGEDTLQAVAFRQRGEAGRTQLRVRGAFVTVGMNPNSALVSGLAELNKKSEVVIGKDCSTSVPGLFAAGDVSDAFGKRIVIASGEGAKAALAARQYVLAARRAKAR